MMIRAGMSGFRNDCFSVDSFARPKFEINLETTVDALTELGGNYYADTGSGNSLFSCHPFHLLIVHRLFV